LHDAEIAEALTAKTCKPDQNAIHGTGTVDRLPQGVDYAAEDAITREAAFYAA
jgi:hypothetical protein